MPDRDRVDFATSCQRGDVADVLRAYTLKAALEEHKNDLDTELA